MSARVVRGGGQDGFTLVEMLLAVAVLGLGVVAVVGGMMTSIKVSAQGEQAADVQTALRGWAEAVGKASYVSCAPPSAYSPAGVGYTPPSGYGSTVAVTYLTSGTAATAAFGSTCTTDAGLQKVTLTVTPPDGSAETLRIAKRRTA